MNYSNLVLKPGKITVNGLTAPIELHQLGSGDGLVVEGNISFLGVGQRFRGDFSNPTISSRGMFQTSTANSNTTLTVIPSGTANIASFSAFNRSDPDNASAIHLRASSTESQILSSISGSGTYLPLCFYTNSIKHMLIDLNGNAIHYGDTNCLVTSQGNNGYGAFYAKASGTNSSYLFFGNATTSETGRIESQSDGSLVFYNGSTANYLASFTSDGRLNIGSIGTADVHIKKTKTGSVNFNIENSSANTGDISNIKQIAGLNAYSVAVDAGGNWVTKAASGNVNLVTEDMPTGATYLWRISGTAKIALNSDGSFGYSSGAGGTVTQVTSKSTAVTLNKPTGQITMINSALAANTSVRFLVNNSSVTTTDSVIVNLQSGFATGNTYRYQVESIGSGTFYISVTNTSAGSLSEALVFNFAVIKGANA